MLLLCKTKEKQTKKNKAMKRIGSGYYQGEYKGVKFEIVKVMQVDASTRNQWYWTIGSQGGDDWFSGKAIAKYFAEQWIEEEMMCNQNIK
jgi:hypothetical protein